MPVLKSSIRGNGIQFGHYLMDNSKNEQARVIEIRGTASPNNIYDSLAEVSAYEQLTRSEQGIWQVVISPKPGEDLAMADDDWKLCMDEIEKQQPGFDNQPRGLVEHVYKGRKHAHAWWSRYDPETETMLPVDHVALNLRTAREEIERKLDHEHLLSWQEKKQVAEREQLKQEFVVNYDTITPQPKPANDNEIDELDDEFERLRKLNQEREKGHSLER